MPPGDQTLSFVAMSSLDSEPFIHMLAAADVQSEIDRLVPSYAVDILQWKIEVPVNSFRCSTEGCTHMRLSGAFLPQYPE